MFSFIISIIGILVTILFVVGTHEAAHFLVAKMLGVKVLRFSIGFGRPLKSWYDKSGTEYVIAPIPLGGYVRMLDESEGNVPEEERAQAYNRQPFYKKFLIVLAGPACNLLCALILYWLIFMIGFVTIKPIIGTVLPHSIAEEAGLKPNQLIQSIENKATDSWTTVTFRLLMHIGDGSQLPIQVSDTKGKQMNTTLNLADWKLNELNPDPLTSLGITPLEPTVPLIIGIIAKNSAAESAGLKVGDKIVSLHEPLPPGAILNTTKDLAQPITDWETLANYVYHHPDKSIQLTVLRDGKKLTLPITLGHNRTLLFKKYGRLGAAPKFTYPANLLSTIQYAPIPALSHAAQQVWDLSRLNLILLGKMFTGKLSLLSLGGPITIFDSAGDALNSGLLAFLSFLAFLSIAIGIINILPIPGLDGGHLFLQVIELVTRRAIPDRIVEFAFRLGFLFLFLVLIQALVNDFLRMH